MLEVWTSGQVHNAHCMALPVNLDHKGYAEPDVLIPSGLASAETQPAHWLRGLPSRADT